MLLWLAFSLLHYYVLIRVSRRCVGVLVYCLFVTLAIACVAVNAWNDVPPAYPDHVRAHAHGHDLCPDVPDPMIDSAHALHNSVSTKALRRLLQQLALAIYVVVRSGCCCIKKKDSVYMFISYKYIRVSPHLPVVSVMIRSLTLTLTTT